MFTTYTLRMIMSISEYIRIYSGIAMYVCVCVYVCVFGYSRVCVCMRVYLGIAVYACVCVCIRVLWCVLLDVFLTYKDST